MKRGIFIAIEGIDGSGKTTLARALTTHLNNNDMIATWTREPSDLPIGKLLRDYLKNPNSPREVDALLFAADRIDHYKNVIEPTLRKGEIIISDRYVFSSYAYQSTQGIELSWIKTINKYAPIPDVILYLEIPPAQAMDRLEAKTDKFENIRFLEKVAQTYKNVLDDYEIFRVDATRPFEEVLQESVKIIMQFIEQQDKQE